MCVSHAEAYIQTIGVLPMMVALAKMKRDIIWPNHVSTAICEYGGFVDAYILSACIVFVCFMRSKCDLYIAKVW